MSKPRILVTCPPMLGLFPEFTGDFEANGLEGVAAKTSQILSEDELIALLPGFDGWIIGDDPASRRVVTAAKAAGLKAAVKWGVGVDNVDFAAFKDLGLPVENTPGVFGGEVADVALTYTLGLARETYRIDREIREKNAWPKPSGISMTGRTVALVGFGDIGRQTAKRILACGSNVVVYDPFYKAADGLDVETAQWPQRLDEADFLIFTCPLTPETRGMFNADILGKLRPVHSAALDVFEVEPLPADSPFREFDQCIFGSHNGSNSADAVRRVSRIAIGKMAAFLGTS